MKSRFSFHALLFAVLAMIASPSSLFGRTPPADVGAGRVAWFDITSNNLDEAKIFYGKLFGWTFEALGATNKAVEIVADGKSIGTLRLAFGKISEANGVVYIQVDDMITKCELVKELGGKLVPGFPFNRSDGAGCIALFSDPSGHPMGIYSKTPLPVPSPAAK